MESLRIFGLSYSSMDMPRERRRPLFKPAVAGSSVLLCDMVRCRSTPGITTEVSSPSPLQKRRMACATFAGCNNILEQ